MSAAQLDLAGLKRWPTPRWPQTKGQPVVVGKRVILVPARWRLARAQGHPVVFLLAADGFVYCITEQGEVQVPRAMQERLKGRYFPVVESPAVARERELIRATNRLRTLGARL